MAPWALARLFTLSWFPCSGYAGAMAQRSPFSRAWSFLNFKPVAKWTALAAAVGSGILYIALLFFLYLFADLMVGQGRVPAFADLPASQREAFPQAWKRLAAEDRLQRVLELRPDEASARKLASDDIPANLTSAEQELLWRAYVAQFLAEHRPLPDGQFERGRENKDHRSVAAAFCLRGWLGGR